MKLIHKYFYNKNEMSDMEYQRSRFGFIFDAAFSNSIACFLAGAYLTGLLDTLGASEAQTNFILSLVLPAGFFQLLVPYLSKKFVHKKVFVFWGRLAEAPMMIFCFFLPFLTGTSQFAVWLTAILVFLRYILGWCMTPFYENILMICGAQGGGLGKFTGVRNSVANTASCISMFIAGTIMKNYAGSQVAYGYMWLAIMAFALWGIQAVNMFFIREPYNPNENSNNSVSLKQILKDTFTIRQLRPYLIFISIYTAGTSMADSLVNVLCIQRLDMSLEIISYLTIGSLILGIFIEPIAGKITDKIGHKKVLIFGVSFVMLSYILHGFMTPSNVLILKILAMVCVRIGASSINAPAFTLSYHSIPAENRSSYLSCIAVIKSIVAYSGTLFITAFIIIAKGTDASVAGFTFNELNISMFISSIVTILSITPFIMRKKQ